MLFVAWTNPNCHLGRRVGIDDDMGLKMFMNTVPATPWHQWDVVHPAIGVGCRKNRELTPAMRATVGMGLRPRVPDAIIRLQQMWSRGIIRDSGATPTQVSAPVCNVCGVGWQEQHPDVCAFCLQARHEECSVKLRSQLLTAGVQAKRLDSALPNCFSRQAIYM